MGLFEKIKKAAPTAGAAAAGAAAAGAAAAGVYAGSTFAKDKLSGDEILDQESNQATSSKNVDDSSSSSTSSVMPEIHDLSSTVTTSSTSVEQSASGKTNEDLIEVNESPESAYDPETGATIYHYVNGNVLTEYADGSRAFYNASTGETTGYDASTGTTITQGNDGDVIAETSDFVGASAVADAMPGSNTSSTKDDLLASIKEINNNIPDEMKAAGLGIPDQPVQEFRTYREGSLEDGQVRYGYEGRAGWAASHSAHHTGRDEVTPGIGLNSNATYDAESFIGASSRGEAGAEWNSEEANLYVHGRTMVGAESNVEAAYKGTLDVDGINHQPGAEVQGHANAFAGAEVKGKGDLNVSSDGARGSLGGEAFAGAKAEIGGSAAASIDGNEFARGKGGVDARAGIGVDANMDMGYQDGQIQYGIDMGAALGVGAGFHYSGSVDAPGIVTHPDAVWESAVEEVSGYASEISGYSTDPSTYMAQAEQYVVQQVQEYVPIPEEVSQVAEVISDPGSVIEDIGSSFGF